ncbi:MAG: hypothetical protein R2857_08095 [Vampirovibrionales bacterium]
MRLSFDTLTDATKGGFAKGVKQFYARSYGQAVPAKIAQLLSGKGGKGGEALQKHHPPENQPDVVRHSSSKAFWLA